jgi:hypothetical protein
MIKMNNANFAPRRKSNLTSMNLGARLLTCAAALAELSTVTGSAGIGSDSPISNRFRRIGAKLYC